MRTEEHAQKHPSSGDHGSVTSYVIGFILSLIFTAIPYYLVVNKVIEGGVLLAAILGIAVLQMAIQLLFFLHLGRGPKPLYNVVFFFATAGVIVVTIGASLFIMDNLYRNMSPEEVVRRQAQEENISQLYGRETGACSENKANHTVVISGGKVSPNGLVVGRCDTLTFVNQNEEALDILFGSPDEPVSYGGLYEITVRTDRPEIITLNETGIFGFYDSQDPNTTGQFSVE